MIRCFHVVSWLRAANHTMGCNTSQEIPSYGGGGGQKTTDSAAALGELLEGDVEEGKFRWSALGSVKWRRLVNDRKKGGWMRLVFCRKGRTCDER